MSLVSSVKVQGGYAHVFTGIVGSAALFVFLMAVFTLSGWSLVAALGIVAFLGLALLAVRMLRSEISVNADKVVLRLRPLRTVSLNRDEIRSVAASSDTSLAEGFGYRVLGKKRRGLLVGGPCVEVKTDEITWIVSCAEPAVTAATISSTATGS